MLVPKNRFLFEVGKTLGLFRVLKLLLFGVLYEVGILKLEDAMRHIYGDLKGVRIDSILYAFNRIPTMPHLHGLFAQLKARNYKTALISSGLPTVLVKKLADSVGADYAYGVDVEQKDGCLTGEIWGNAIIKNGKLTIMREILNQEKLQPQDTVVVADDRNNRCIFLEETLKIGFNPDFIIRIISNRVVNGKLSNIIPVIDGKPHQRNFPSTNDLIREDIHAAGFFMPVIAGMIGIPIVTATIITIAIIYTISELFRLEGRTIPLVSAITRHAASQSELYSFAAAPIYFAFGIVATMLLFPTQAGGAAIAMFCLGDSAASLFGGLISTSLPFNKGKTWEGSVAGFFFAFLAGCIFVSPPLALVGAAFAMTIEVLPLPVNDNVVVPILTGAFLTLLV